MLGVSQYNYLCILRYILRRQKRHDFPVSQFSYNPKFSLPDVARKMLQVKKGYRKIEEQENRNCFFSF